MKILRQKANSFEFERKSSKMSAPILSVIFARDVRRARSIGGQRDKGQLGELVKQKSGKIMGRIIKLEKREVDRDAGDVNGWMGLAGGDIS